ncbi:DUF2304 domain-containing protein [Paenibacillus durus]|uniref:DUF2304 domain-containing protein n=1 Tax=Paenibacillus durus ATCC 35681 TaxID=1333534 RepID=A0A0F7FDE1_PAEDU|nr:hypothetical protein VK70_19860 [Paenibacillus durus ATCC 35681]
MFPFKLQITLIVLSILLLFLLINMIKKYELQLRYALLWIFLVFLMLIVSIFPGIAFYFTQAFGFETPSNFVFLLGILSALIIIFSLTVSISNLANKLRQISQEVGLLKNEIEKMKKN